MHLPARRGATDARAPTDAVRPRRGGGYGGRAPRAQPPTCRPRSRTARTPATRGYGIRPAPGSGGRSPSRASRAGRAPVPARRRDGRRRRNPRRGIVRASASPRRRHWGQEGGSAVASELLGVSSSGRAGGDPRVTRKPWCHPCECTAGGRCPRWREKYVIVRREIASIARSGGSPHIHNPRN